MAVGRKTAPAFRYSAIHGGRIRVTGIPVIISTPNAQDFLVCSAVNAAPLIEITDLTKVYHRGQRPALDGLALAIRRGAFFGCSGRTVLAKYADFHSLWSARADTRCRACTWHQCSGRCSTREIGHRPGAQDLALYPTLTARENLSFFGRMQGLSGARLKERVAACLAIARLEDLADRHVDTYSGGLKRRLNLVIGLIHEPQLLILDEPTVGIDPQSRNFIHEALRTLHQPA